MRETNATYENSERDLPLKTLPTVTTKAVVIAEEEASTSVLVHGESAAGATIQTAPFRGLGAARCLFAVFSVELRSADLPGTSIQVFNCTRHGPKEDRR